VIIVMRPGAGQEQVDHVCRHITELGYKPHPIYGKERVVIGAIGGDVGKEQARASLSVQEGVESAQLIQRPYKRVSREMKAERTIVDVGGVKVGGDTFCLFAGPCSVEDAEQLMAAAKGVKAAGAQILRGGAFKPRSSPYSFQGLAEDGLQLLAEAREETGMPFVTEVLTVRNVDLVARYADMLQIGARNMMNYQLLREVGKTGKPVLLKRGLAATIEELLMSAEYIADEGNEQIVLCERGIRTFETYTRNTLDLSCVPAVHELSNLPIVVDPSHGTGVRELVGPMVNAAAACGADGAMVEVHPAPEAAFSDGEQSLVPDDFADVVARATPFIEAAGKTL
jgi:3-deoxy-7-phosphoheptulonate synthase